MLLSAKLKEKRAAHLDAMKALNALTGGDTPRLLTADEQKAFDADKDAITALDIDIARAVAQEEFARTAAPAPAVHTGRTDRPGEVRAYRHDERMFTPTGDAADQPNLGNLVRALATGDWSRAQPELRAIGETPPSSGQFLVPGQMFGQVVDLARNMSVMVRAGTLSIPMDSQTLTVAKLLADPTASFRNEAQQIAESQPTFGPLVFTARSLACLVKISNELLADAVDGGASITNAMAMAVATAMDLAGLNGSGVAPIPLGILQTGGIGTVSMGVDGAVPASYKPFVNAQGIVLSANEMPVTWIHAPRTQTDLDNLTNTVGDPMGAPASYVAIPKLISNQLPTNQGQGTSGAVCSSSLVGDFSKGAFGIRQTAMMEVSNSAAGSFGTVETYVRIVARVDYHALRPAAFCRVIGIKDSP